MSLVLMLAVPALVWFTQAIVSIHRTNMRQMRREMPVLFGRDNRVRVWFGF